MGGMQEHLDLTRAHGLALLAEIQDDLGRHYAAQRNTDRGADGPATTSRLSPYLRRRLLLEQEVVAAAQALHAEGAEKFVQEVFWRTYFKGHLETRPWLWTQYRALAVSGHARLAAEPGLRAAYEQAITGRTGIDGFDDWARELTEQNWLHNHVRMWFASIWIFTLGLPWALGADFFMRHLIDGDPASNTLSWRWVAGLHTRGKHYVARAENIARYTDGRYRPTNLNEVPEPLDEPEGPAPLPLPAAAAPPEGDVVLVLHLDDLHPESLDLGRARVVGVRSVVAHADAAAAAVCLADRTAMDDALARATEHFGCPSYAGDGHFDGPSCAGEGTNQDLPALSAWAPVGPSAAAMPALHGIRRGWDSAVWPRSTRGFFKVKQAIPAVLQSVGIVG